MPSREEILARTRGGRAATPLPASEEIRSLLVDRIADPLASLIQELEAVSGKAFISSETWLPRDLSAYLERAGAKRVILSRDVPVTVLRRRIETVFAGEVLDVRDPGPAKTPFKESLAQFDTGVTGCAALVAETGTVLLASSPEQPRSASLLPERHVVVARASQVVGTLAEALSRFPVGSLPTALTLVTGPSRTADIEKVLVLGVHGPRELAVFILND